MKSGDEAISQFDYENALSDCFSRLCRDRNDFLNSLGMAPIPTKSGETGERVHASQ